ncbi:MAG: nucleoside phosphorylase [Proteobacteria bacterium]|nr:nucleoside phosphorylase [Pseudomonadota bacterium]
MRQYHIALEKGEVGRYAFLPGNPGRVEKMARYLDDPVFVRQNREYCCWNGTLLGETVSIVSTGIGGPSAAIAMEELGAIGVDTFIRTGTCGALQPHVGRGDLIIATASVRGGATANAYVPLSFPAVAHHSMVANLIEAASKRQYRHATGIIQCKDAFYLEDPEMLPRHAKAEEDWDTWRRAGVVASEMESDTLFVIASIRGYRMGTVLVSLGGTAGETEMVGTTADELERLTLCAFDALKIQILKDREGT